MKYVFVTLEFTNVVTLLQNGFISLDAPDVFWQGPPILTDETFLSWSSLKVGCHKVGLVFFGQGERAGAKNVWPDYLIKKIFLIFKRSWQRCSRPNSARLSVQLKPSWLIPWSLQSANSDCHLTNIHVPERPNIIIDCWGYFAGSQFYFLLASSCPDACLIGFVAMAYLMPASSTSVHSKFQIPIKADVPSLEAPALCKCQ